jgi:hypothetical protein
MSLRDVLVREVRRAFRAARSRSGESRPSSRKLFLYWSLRNAGESDIESTLRLAELEGPEGKPRSTAAFCVANGMSLWFDPDARRAPVALKQFESFESVVRAGGGIRERMDLVEAENRKALKVEADSLQTRLTVLTFILFIVPFAALLTTSYVMPEGASFTAAFLAAHPLLSYLVANWATMRDDILAV